MNNLAKVFVFKIATTILFWSTSLILLPPCWLKTLGFPQQDTYMFIRLLGFAYLSLCVEYWFGLKASLKGKRAMGSILVGIVSNGSACLCLCYFGLVGTWVSWNSLIQFALWASVATTFFITLGLYLFGVRGDGNII